MSERLTRKQKRIQQQQSRHTEPSKQNDLRLNFKLKHIDPLTENQKKTFNAYHNEKNLVLHGIAGTGKSFIANYLAIKQVLEGESRFKKVVIVRSVVPTRDMGFLPGSSKDKAKVYEAPYYAIYTELFNRGDAYEYLKQKSFIEFISTSFIRGITLNDSIVIVDEIANLSLHELDSVITRIGQNCKVIFCGDYRQSDFTRDNERAGLLDFMKIVTRMKSFETIDFEREDIVRSALVKEYIIMKDNLNIVV